MLSHDNLVWTVESAFAQMAGAGEKFNEEDRMVSYLPLSHIAGLMLDVISNCKMGNRLYFARPDEL